MRRYRKATLPLLALLCLAIGGDSADAGIFTRRARTTEVYRYSARTSGCPGGTCSVATRAAPQVGAAAPSVALPTPRVSTADPGGFVAWLNATRARRGLGPVVLDPALSASAAANNAAQRARGLGHFVRASPYQNAAQGGGNPGPMWLSDGPHAAPLLSPLLTRVGIAYDGLYWTMDGA